MKRYAHRSVMCIIACVILFCGKGLCLEESVGTTFSSVQCAYLDEPWSPVYEKIISLGFDIIRLGAYWNHIEKKEGVFDFKALDFQILQAKKHNVKVILTVGMKAPRWPEYFIPGWVIEKGKPAYGSDVSKKAYLRERALIFIKEVIKNYADEDAIVCWQVENEPLDRAGPKLWYIGKDFLKEEAALIRQLDDNKRPLLINIATYPNPLLRRLNKFLSKNNSLQDALDVCDILGLNIYPNVGHRFLGINLVLRAGPEERDKYFSGIMRRAKDSGKPVWVTELQAEPWDPGKLVHKDKGQPHTCRAVQFSEYFSELKALGIETILLWGAEYWFFRQQEFNDASWLDTARRLIK